MGNCKSSSQPTPHPLRPVSLLYRSSSQTHRSTNWDLDNEFKIPQRVFLPQNPPQYQSSSGPFPNIHLASCKHTLVVRAFDLTTVIKCVAKDWRCLLPLLRIYLTFFTATVWTEYFVITVCGHPYTITPLLVAWGTLRVGISGGGNNLAR